MRFRRLDEARRNGLVTPVTPEVAGSSPVAPSKPVQSGMLCCLGRQGDSGRWKLSPAQTTHRGPISRSTMQFCTIRVARPWKRQLETRRNQSQLRFLGGHCERRQPPVAPISSPESPAIPTTCTRRRRSATTSCSWGASRSLAPANGTPRTRWRFETRRLPTE